MKYFLLILAIDGLNLPLLYHAAFIRSKSDNLKKQELSDFFQNYLLKYALKRELSVFYVNYLIFVRFNQK